MEINLKSRRSAKGGSCWNCSVGIDSNRVMVLLVICLPNDAVVLLMCDECLT